jgi:hypothetical protein
MVSNVKMLAKDFVKCRQLIQVKVAINFVLPYEIAFSVPCHRDRAHYYVLHVPGRI